MSPTPNELNRHQTDGKEIKQYSMRAICNFTFCVSRKRREMYRGHARLCVCLPVCVSVRGRMPTHYCTDPDVTWGVVGDAP